ncbi:Gfo/Idh/MocA family protein [Actinomadura viridis]|uniref:Gfo/Idh/MocA family protein n=1 Tax=Actinomadura viridis TaxID=58110 RepID=UPI00367824C4
MAPLRVGLVGFGWMNRTVWLPRLRAHPRCQVVAILDPYHPEVPGPQAKADLGEFLRNRMDLAIIATPNRTHTGLAKACLDAGITVLLEKPPCLCAGELRGLREHAERAGARVLVSRPASHRRDVRALRRMAGLLLDPPFQVEAEWLRGSGLPRPGSWFTDRRAAGGGALIDLGWHVAEVALGLLGFPRPVEVTAELAEPPGVVAGGAGWRGDSAAPGRVTVEADGRLAARFADRSRLALRAAWRSRTPVDVTRFTVTGGGRVELVTTFGFSPHRVPRPRLTLSADGRGHDLPAAAPLAEEYDRQLDEAVALAAGDADWRPGLEESAAVLDLLSGAYSAAGRPLAA